MSNILPYRREEYLERPLPSDASAEQFILAAVLLDNLVMAQAAEKLKEKDFYSPLHRRVFAAMMTLYQTNRQIDPITIGDIMQKESSLESIGGTTTITNLTFGMPHFSDIGEYIDIVRKHSLARQLLTVCNMTTHNILSRDTDVIDVVDLHEQMIFELRTEQDKTGWQHIGPAASSVMADQEAIIRGDKDVPKIPTGFPDLDNLLDGLHKTDLVIIAGRPSMGKTSFALTLVLNAVKFQNYVVAVFTLEMSIPQIAKRMMLMDSRVNSHAFKRGFLQDSERAKLMDTIHQFQSRGIHFDDTIGITPMQIKAKARMLKQRYGRLDLVVIDYIQLMTHHKKSESRQQEVSSISRDLKSLGKELDVPVVALSQLSRAPEARKPPRPLMSDLRESGSIEQDADVVGFMYRPAYYTETEENKLKAEIIIAKNRNGPTGTANLAWIKEFTRFENLDHHQPGF